MKGPRTPEQKERRNELQRMAYRRAADLSEEELAARRAIWREEATRRRAADRVKYNQDRNAYQKQRRQRIRDEILDALGNKCAGCGEEDPRVLQIDHVDGGGRAHRAIGGSETYYLSMKKVLDKLQILCANCHMIKSYRQSA